MSVVSPQQSENLVDLSCERSVLAGIIQYGSDCYDEIADVIQQPSAFFDTQNQAIFKVVKHLYENKSVTNIDQASLISTISELNLDSLFSKAADINHLRSILNTQILEDNVLVWAAKLRKLEIARLLINQLHNGIASIEQIKGNESIDSILGIAENCVFDFSDLLVGEGGNPQLIGDGVRDYFRDLILNPVDQVGISSGYPHYDAHIGGGFRRKSVSLLGARTGIGKSTLCMNIGLHVAGENNIPVLYLDTEMYMEDHWNRMMAKLTGIPINIIETGKFGSNPDHINLVKEKLKYIEASPFYYRNVSGLPVESVLSIMRKWIKKNVGYDENGNVNDCLIIYDYIKLMSGEGLNASLKEYQALGFIMTSLHNFAVKHDVPIFSLVQLNRDGIDKETTDVVSGSDRVVWLCTNLAIYKTKSDEEMSVDGDENGTHKLVVIKARHGGGTKQGDYINFKMKGEIASIIEGNTHLTLKNKKKKNQQEQAQGLEDESVPFG